MWWTRRYRPQAIQHFLLVGSTVEVETPIGVIDVTVEAPAAQRSSRNPIRRAIEAVLHGPKEAGVAEKRRGVETAPDAQGMLRGRIFVLPRQKRPEDRDRQQAWSQQAWIRELHTTMRSNGKLDDAALDAFLPKVGEAAVRREPPAHCARIRIVPYRRSADLDGGTRLPRR
ncbi:MAG: hypothetical protein WDN24_06310 [Sphingomonas sp.]